MCLIIDRSSDIQSRLPLVDSCVRLKSTVHLTDRILPSGSLYFVRVTQSGEAYLEDMEGNSIHDYYNVGNFQPVN